MTKIVVIGLDGADWETIRSWAEEGWLPNMKKLMEGSSHGPLESTIPAVTSTAWTSMLSGKRPEKHGILGFTKVERTDSGWNLSVYTSKDKRSPELWDYVDGVIAVNVPFSYPTREVNGILVSGMGTPSIHSQFTYPPEFRDELLRVVPNYELDIDLADYRGKGRLLIDKIYELTEKRIKLLRYLLNKENWRLLFYIFTETDRIQHAFWGRNEVKLYWKYLDDFMGELVEIISTKAEKNGEDIYLILVSDHGFSKLRGKIDVNCLFRKMRILKEIRGVMGDSLKSFLEGIFHNLLILIAFIYLKLPEKLKDLLSPLAFRVMRSKHGGAIILKHYDYTNSPAFCVNESSCGYVFLNPSLTSDERNSLLSRIRAELEKAFRGKGGEGPLIRILDGRDVYEDPSPGVMLPDLILVPREGYVIASTTTPSCLIEIESDAMTRGVHRLQGMFLIHGPEIRSNHIIEGAKIYDVLPTILHILGIPVPRDVDGRVLKEVFKSNSTLSRREIVYGDSPTRMREEVTIREIIRRLRETGRI
ncbi:MAG: alkaline phosphatase family protein [Candidatus Korarchaeum sp.]